MQNSLDYGPRDLIGYGETAPDPRWPNGTKIALSFVLNYEEGSEVCPENGDAVTEVLATELGPGVQPSVGGVRDVNIESLYEYGSRCGVWRVLRLFEEHDTKLTIFAVGQALEKNPQAGKAFVRGGHEVASHGWRWVDRSGWTAAEEKENVKRCVRAIEKATGRPPRGWYYGMIHSKAAERSRSILAQTFAELGLPLLWYGDAYNDDLPYWVPYPGGPKQNGLLIIPYTMDTNDYKNAGYQAYITGNQFFEYLRDSFDELYREGEQSLGCADF
ncbi:hypothetical protein KL942_004351 [Ogataea angusta]|uniref:NodB homology domain-containing protein n=1 Tax=Pichia angusta TaxID=870730 RepID=A0ABQ7RU64_PICAN|nr:hypothetical protein KL942_004351 [Ogataea angusta]KAG7847572.1 hypothetical protein KL940_003484 [Ogataea angusta]